MTNDTPHYDQFSLEFYRERASEYAALRQVFADRSHLEFREDRDLYRRSAELAPPGQGLDAGCGAGALEMSYPVELGFEMFGLDAVAENIQVARSQHPEFADRLRVADIQDPLPFDDSIFEVVLCNAVIQHVPRDAVFARVFPEFARVLRPGGVLQLMFKPGSGVETAVDGPTGAREWPAALFSTMNANCWRLWPPWACASSRKGLTGRWAACSISRITSPCATASSGPGRADRFQTPTPG